MNPGFVRQGGGISFYPENGTTYLQGSLGDSLKFIFIGRVFDLVSIDLAEYSTVVPVSTVPFVGYRHDGSIVTTNMTPDGIIDGTGPLADFETFYFDDRFTGLDRVEIPTYGWSLDNLFVRPIPEPSSGSLLFVGSLLFSILRCAKRADFD
jgi:hypothetical protein